MRFRHALSALAVVLLFPWSVQAEIITFSANDYAVGTDVSEALPGLSVSTVSGTSFWDPVFSPVLVGYGGYGSLFGSQDLGRTYYAEHLMGGTCVPGMYPGADPSTCDNASYRLQEFRFDAPTSFVEISAASGVDGSLMFAYDAAGNLLEMCGWWGGAVGDPTCVSLLAPLSTMQSHVALTFQRDQSDISRVLFGGLAGTAAITSVEYGVPEPASLLLVLMGAAGFRLARRRSVADSAKTGKRTD